MKRAANFELKYLLFLTAFICTVFTGVFAQVTKAKHYKSNTPFQGTRHFCSDYSKQTYDVTIKGNGIVISYPKFKAKGIFKNGLVFTNDPHEIEYRHSAGKYNYGKYYIIEADYFSVLIAE